MGLSKSAVLGRICCINYN